MGLFGGFRAKFTKDSTAKSASKKSKSDEVVCLGYRVYSEFQDPPSYVLQPGPASHRKPSAIKTVLPRPESGKNGTAGVSTPRAVETRIITNPSVKKSSIKQTTKNSKASIAKASNINNQELTSSHTSNATKNLTEVKGDNESDINANIGLLNADKHLPEINTVELRRDKANDITRSALNSLKFEDQIQSINTASSADASPDNQYVTQNQTAPKSILKSKSLEDLNELNNYIVQYSSSDSEDDEYNKHLTLTSMSIKKGDESETKSVNYLTATRTVSGTHTTQVTTMIHMEDTSTTNDQLHETKSYTYSQNNRSIGATSNHAANIFFDGDDEPEVQTERIVNLNSVQVEVEPRSSAEC